MRGACACLIALIVSCGAAPAAEDAPLKKAVKVKVEEINRALIKEDFAKVADLTHPRVVKLMGGRDKMIATLATGMKAMKAQGFAPRSAKVDEPSDPVAAGPDLFVVVPYQLEIKVPGGKLLQKSFVIGVSGDRGKSWSFVNGDLDVKQVKAVLPHLPEKLKLPEKQKPVFVKD
jgi:hypothetical protein